MQTRENRILYLSPVTRKSSTDIAAGNRSPSVPTLSRLVFLPFGVGRVQDSCGICWAGSVVQCSLLQHSLVRGTATPTCGERAGPPISRNFLLWSRKGFAAYQSRRRVWVRATFFRAYPPGPASDGERRGSAPWWLVEETADICGGGAAGASMETDMDRDLHTDLSRQGHAIFALRCIIARNSLLYEVPSTVDARAYCRRHPTRLPPLFWCVQEDLINNSLSRGVVRPDHRCGLESDLS
jgi:hypothetical protein